MDIPSWIIDLAKSLGAGSAPILGVVCFLLWRENGKLRDRLFERLNRSDELLDQLGSALTVLTGGVANDLQKRLSEKRVRPHR